MVADGYAVGMGPAEDGELPENPFGIDVEVTDHSDETGADITCTTMPDRINEDCILRNAPIGKSLGKWGVFNNCKTFVTTLLNACDPAWVSSYPYYF